MTPFTQPTIDTHIRVYMDQVSSDIRLANSSENRIRRAIARGLVRTGAWLLSNEADSDGDIVIILPTQQDGSTTRAAA